MDCGNPGNPRDLNGQVNFTTTTLGSKAQYNIVCSAGCDPVGNSTRTCTAEGIWSGTIPECQGKVDCWVQQELKGLMLTL